MNVIIEGERKLEAAQNADVLVLGSGPAGIGAALAAARAGARTVLIEKDGVLKGVSTSGLMSHWTGTLFRHFASAHSE